VFSIIDVSGNVLGVFSLGDRAYLRVYTYIVAGLTCVVSTLSTGVRCSDSPLKGQGGVVSRRGKGKSGWCSKVTPLRKVSLGLKLLSVAAGSEPEGATASI
jgi:hypothetical protein